ncbi:MAG: ABC transporter substrate-binding protein [Clostridia bacterium]|nr:ABC transporter substrate-binding protein [Clostridia bacterium]
MVRNRLIATLVALILVCGLMAGASGAFAEGKHLNAAIYWFGTSLDPATEYDGWTTSRAGITETLVTVNENYELVPQLADSWEQIDELTWKLHIREGVTFHNGKPVDGEAVKKSFERAMSIQERAVTAAKLDSIEADGQDVIFHTSVLNAAFLASISEPLYSIIDVDADTDPKSCPIATGPFMVKDFEVDTFIEMESYDGYWNGPSQIDTVTLKCIADDSTRALAIQSGEIDLMQRVGANDVDTFKDNPNYTIYNTLGARTRIVVLNFGNEFLADINVRRALAASINYDALVMILGDTVGVAGAPYPSSSPYGYDTLDVQHYDPEAAAQYLADAGFADSDGDGYMDKDGNKLTLKINYANAAYTVMLEAVQAMSKQSGIDLQLNLVDSIMEMTQGQVGFDIVVTNWQVLSTGDPQWFLESQYRTGAANNGGHYSNPELDAIADKLAQTTDVDERVAVTIEAEKILLDDVASIYLVGETNFVLSSSKVGNVTPYPIDYYFLDAGITVE